MTHEERMQKLEELWQTVRLAQAYSHKFDSVTPFSSWDANRVKERAQKLHDELFPESSETVSE